MKDPVVSILMNCYNGEAYLREAIQSVLDQTFQDWEIIFWDNQSTDNSAAIVKSYADPRIRYFFAPTHELLHVARIAAFEQTRAPWIAYLDTDDVWVKEKLSIQMRMVRECEARGEDVVLLYSPSRLLYEHDGKAVDVGPRPQGDIFQQLRHGNFISLPTVLVRKQTILEVGGIHPKIRQAGDYYLWLKISQKHKVHASDKILATYRIHANSLTELRPARIGSEIFYLKLRFFHTVDWEFLRARLAWFFRPLKELLKGIRDRVRTGGAVAL